MNSVKINEPISNAGDGEMNIWFGDTNDNYNNVH